LKSRKAGEMEEHQQDTTKNRETRERRREGNPETMRGKRQATVQEFADKQCQ
jgi:hypothetical protein